MQHLVHLVDGPLAGEAWYVEAEAIIPTLVVHVQGHAYVREPGRHPVDGAPYRYVWLEPTSSGSA